jgi:ABC-type sugar transport system ATPase subunit
MEKVQRAVQILDIEDYLFSRPRELSGGQRQRVALGRSIVRNAKLFLMDEPLSNLDAKLRISMRSEIVALHRSLGATTIYVTHDQIEAMTMADRIVVMKDGYIQQVGTPLEIYHQPLNVFVATFMGSPAMNIISSNYQKGMITVNGTGLKLTDKMIETIKLFIDKKIGELNDKYHQTQAYLDSLITEREQLSKSFKHKSLEQRINAKQGLLKEILTQKEAYDKASKEDTQELLIGVRPENLVISQQQSQDSITAEVTFVELLGKEYYVHLLVNNTRVIASVSPKEQFNIGDRVGLELNYSSVSIFDPISELRII